MRKISNKLIALLLSAALCLSMLAAASGCSKKPDGEASSTDVSAADAAPEPSGLLYDENGVPYFYESFENAENTAIPRGDVALEVIDNDDGSKALKISNRTNDWNGANFPADVFSGNKIRCTANMSCIDSNMRISIQYDMAGATSYAWVTTVKGASKFTTLSDVFDVPEGAANVFVYVESDGLADICLDDIKVTVEGEYKAPEGAGPLTFADFSDYPSLKEVYDGKFTFGCAIPTYFVDSDVKELINLVTDQFNTVTLENELKPDSVLDYAASVADPDKYNKAPAIHTDHLTSTLDYCKEHGIAVRGHTLLWHEQTPEWLFHKNYDVNAELESRDVMLARMENYIKSVFTWAQDNYPGLFYGWDVVNEAVEDSTGKLRKLNWYNTVGDDYVEKAFEFARKYAPDGVKLFYNDYNAYQSVKRDGIIEVLKPIAAAGNIDGVGMQAHISTAVNIDTFVDSAKKYADELGVVVNVTELDVSMPGTDNPEYDQGVFMKNLFSALLDARNKGLPLEAVTVWGICDSLSWKASDRPVLFAADLSRKPAFDGVVCAVTGEDVPKPADYIEPGEIRPIIIDFEDNEIPGKPRASSKLKITTDEAYEGKASLCCSDGQAEWDGYSINVTNYIGKKFEYSFAIKSTCDECRFTADIDGVWPNIEQIDTSGGDWVYCEGTYECPADLTELYVYFETANMDAFYVDSIVIRPAA